MTGMIYSMRGTSLAQNLPRRIFDEVRGLGYEFSAQLGIGRFGAVYGCTYTDSTSGETSDLAVKHIDFTRLYEYEPQYRQPTGGERTGLSVTQRIRLMLGLERELLIEVTPGRSVVVHGETLRSEARALNRVNHPNVIRLANYMQFDSRSDQQNPNPDHVLLFMERADTDLARKQEFGRFGEEETRDYCAQIARGLAHLHSKGIAHLDLKPENVLVFDTPGARHGVVLKITDFGLSVMFPVDPHTQSAPDDQSGITDRPPAGTAMFRDPLVDRVIAGVTSDQCDAYKADIWSLGVSVLCMLFHFVRINNIYMDYSRHILHPDSVESNVELGQYFMRELMAAPNVSVDLQDFMRSILQNEQRDRPSAVDLCLLGWLRAEVAHQRRVWPSFTEGRRPSLQSEYSDSSSSGIEAMEGYFERHSSSSGSAEDMDAYFARNPDMASTPP